MLIAYDGGYFNSKWKTSNGRNLFRSRVSDCIMDINRSDTINLNGKEYTVGAYGQYATDNIKIDDKVFQLCLYNSIANGIVQSYGHYGDYIDINLVTGLPIGYYKSQKHLLSSSLKGQDVKLLFNDEYNIKFVINEVMVFPQSAGTVLLNPNKFLNGRYNCIVDIGGYTVDVSLFKGTELINHTTVPYGILMLYKSINDVLQNRGLEYDRFDISDIVKYKSIIVNSRQEPFEVDDICKKYIKYILGEIRLNIPQFNMSYVTFTGGGSAELKDYIDYDIMPNSVYTNVDAFFKIGLEKLGDK